MSENKGLAKLRDLFAKAAGMGPRYPTQDQDELDNDLDEDFEDLDASKEDTKEEIADIKEENEEEGQIVAQAGPETSGQQEELAPVDAMPLIQAIDARLTKLEQLINAQGRQTAMIAKGLMGLVDEQAATARKLDNTPLVRKAGQQRPAAPQQSKQAAIDIEGIVAKAVTAVGHFKAHEVAKLDSMLKGGKLEQITYEFTPEQLAAVGFPVKGAN